MGNKGNAYDDNGNPIHYGFGRGTMGKKVIFESEEDAVKMITTCICVNTHAKQIDLDATIFHLKNKGYIRKTPVEEAESVLMTYKENCNMSDSIEMYPRHFDIILNGFQELKAENERLKNDR